MSTIPVPAASDYSLTVALPGIAFDEAVARVRASLADEGFGVLTEIDVQATLKKKLNAETRPYLILGACNPPLAHRALQEEPVIGVLLPCNVVVSGDDANGVVVSAVDPVAMFQVVGRADIEPLALEVRGRLERVLHALGGAK